jgi:hypothetical protein
MGISTQSAWNYGHTVTQDNSSINFLEPTGTNTELLAELSIGTYSLGEFANEVSRAMTGASNVQEYQVTIDRNTNQLTINGILAENFNLLVSSGSQSQVSAFGLMGFTGADLTGASTYQGDSASGSQYRPQFLLQNFIDFDNDQSTASSSVNTSADGQTVEVISYGNERFLSCDIKFITDIIGQTVITNNPSGVDDARNFLEYAITKGNMEFVYDVDNPSVFNKCLLESTQQSRNGTGFRLVEQYAKKLAGYYDVNGLKFRKLD